MPQATLSFQLFRGGLMNSPQRVRSSESRRFDHKKIIRTCFYSEKRSDYFYDLSIHILIAKMKIASDKDFPNRRLNY